MTATPESARVAVTGLGAVTGYGEGVAALWDGLCSGRTDIAPIDDPTLFDAAPHRTQIASTVALPAHRHRGRADRFATAAAEEAMRQAFGDAGPPPDLGVFFGSSTGALLETEQVMDRLLAEVRPLGLRRLASQQHNGPGDTVARRLGAQGPVVNLSSACASSSMALVAALDALRDGECDVAVCGGADELAQLTYAGFNALRAVDHAPTRPYRADRGGLSLGEGAGVLVLEREAHARARGATVLAWLAGGAATCDAHHMSAPVADGRGAADAIRRALAEAAVPPDEVAFVNVHGTGTPQNDAAEWAALGAVFGDRRADVPVSATKGSIGHLLGASGGIEAVITVLCLAHRRLPPTPGGGAVDPALPARLVFGAGLDIPGARAGLSTNLAFGGANCALVFTAEGA